MVNDMRLKGKVALITGAGRGIGKEIALKFAKEGAIVITNSLSDSAEKTAEEIRANGGQSLAISADVSSQEAVEKMFEKAAFTYGNVDILVNNAGITSDQLLVRMKEAQWDSVISTNLKSVFLCTREAMKPMMKKRWGRIINISSVIGLCGNAGQTNYAAAKAGIIGFTKSTAKESGTRGITVNAIAPGYIETDMTGKLSPIKKQEIQKLIPMGRMGKPEDIASIACFLASDEASYITGQVFNVDGGMVMD